jgi:hypothetical protein
MEPNEKIGLFATNIPFSLFMKKFKKGTRKEYGAFDLVYDCKLHGNEL